MLAIDAVEDVYGGDYLEELLLEDGSALNTEDDSLITVEASVAKKPEDSDSGATNEQYKSSAIDFIDFSEMNPFSEGGELVMFGGYFYHGAIRKYIIMFGSMFNDIDVVRYDKQGNRVQGIRVPIAYGPKEKFLARLNQDPGLDRQVATQLPRMSFEVTDMAYSRHQNS